MGGTSIPPSNPGNPTPPNNPPPPPPPVPEPSTYILMLTGWPARRCGASQIQIVTSSAISRHAVTDPNRLADQKNHRGRPHISILQPLQSRAMHQLVGRSRLADRYTRSLSRDSRRNQIIRQRTKFSSRHIDHQRRILRKRSLPLRRKLQLSRCMMRRRKDQLRGRTTVRQRSLQSRRRRKRRRNSRNNLKRNLRLTQRRDLLRPPAQRSADHPTSTAAPTVPPALHRSSASESPPA